MSALLSFLGLVLTVVVIVNVVLAAYWYRARIPVELWGRFHGELVYRKLRSAKGEHRQHEIHRDTDLSFERPNGEIIHAEVGLVTDGMSGKSILWPLIGSPFTGKGSFVWPIHDTICKRKDRTYQEAALVAYEACQAEGMWFRSHYVYRALLIGGSKW